MIKENIEDANLFESWLSEERAYLETKQAPLDGNHLFLEREYVRLLRLLSDAE